MKLTNFEQQNGSELLDVFNLNEADRKIYIENIIASGESIRTILKQDINQIKSMEISRHYKIGERAELVKEWFHHTESNLELLYESRMNAAKFRNSHTVSFDRASAISSDFDGLQRYLEELDGAMKRGVRKLEMLIEDKTTELKDVLSISGDYVARDKVGRDKNVSKKVIKPGEKKNSFIWWLLGIAATVITALTIDWFRKILNP